MSGCLFFLHHSVQFPLHWSNRASDTDLVELTRSLQGRYDSVECVAWQPGEWEDADTLRRHGFSLEDGPDPTVWLGERLGEIEPGTTLVVAANQEVGRYLIEHLGYEPSETWTTGVELNDAASRSSGAECSLFVDWSYLQQVGEGLFEGDEGIAIAEHLASLASMAGHLVEAGAYRAPGEMAAVDLLNDWAPLRASQGSLREDLASRIEAQAGPHTWVVMAPGRSWHALPRAARGRGHRFVLWGEGDAPPEVDAFIDAGRLLHGFRTPTQRHAHPVYESEAIVDASVGHWVRLAYYVECAQRQSPSGRLDYGRLVAALSQHEEYGPNPETAEGALRRALDAGLVQLQEDRTCRLNANHPAARFAVEVPERVLRLLNQMLQRMPWVSFKLLRSVLAREQWLGGSTYGLDESQIDDWINFMIRDGALSMSKEPNLVAPEFPVTALRVNPSHALTGAPPAPESSACSLSRERAILAVDHFLLRQHKPWMSMGALRRALERLGRDELQEVLRSLQACGALVTERYPNPQREQPTTGCRLRHDNPIVAETLATRNTLLRAAVDGEGADGWTPLSRVELVFAEGGATSESRQRAWLRLLLDEDLLELSGDPDDLVRGGAHARCRVNRRDSVVRTIFGEERESVTEQPAPASTAPPSFRSLTRRPIEPQEPAVAN